MVVCSLVGEEDRRFGTTLCLDLQFKMKEAYLLNIGTDIPKSNTVLTHKTIVRESIHMIKVLPGIKNGCLNTLYYCSRHNANGIK
jgi:hypothetical protein